MTWPSGDPNQPPYPNQPGYYPPPAYAPHGPPPPPPMPYQQAYQPAPKKSRKGLIIALVAIAVVLVGGVIAVGTVVYFVTKDKVIATDLAVGDCLTDIPDGTLISVVPTVACDDPHSGEVYAVLTMPDGDYPGGPAIDAWQNRCPAELQSYSPDAMADESVGVFVLYPTAETWATGDRVITCIATTDDKRTGSIRG